MISAFLLLGGCAVGFGAALRAALGGRQAGLSPWLIQLAGVLTIASPLLLARRIMRDRQWSRLAAPLVAAAVER